MLKPLQLYAEEFRPLFNNHDLAGWNRYLGSADVPALPFDWFVNKETLLGFNHDEHSVFSIVKEDDKPAIRISGEIWGALISHEEFYDYHLKLEFKWGDTTFPPRKTKPRNSGVLYHSYGEAGSFWGYWMKSVEFEIMENATGDIYTVGGVEANIPSARDFDQPFPWLRYERNGKYRLLSGFSFRVTADSNHELPTGEWNTLDIVSKGDASWHFVNGALVLAANDIRSDQGKPLIKGRIQLQSEGAEIFFRNIAIKQLSVEELSKIKSYIEKISPLKKPNKPY